MYIFICIPAYSNLTSSLNVKFTPSIWWQICKFRLIDSSNTYDTMSLVSNKKKCLKLDLPYALIMTDGKPL